MENISDFSFSFFQTPTPSADNSPDNSGAEDQDRSDSEGPKFRNSQDFHENDTNANENIPMNGTVITNNITITKEEINDNDDFEDYDNNADPQRLKGFNVSFNFHFDEKILAFYILY